MISCKNLNCTCRFGEFDLLSSSERLEKLLLQENDCDGLRHSRLEIMNIGRCYATRLYAAGFFSSYAIKELQEKIELEICGTRKTRVVCHCFYPFWKLGGNTVWWQVEPLCTPAATVCFDCTLRDVIETYTFECRKREISSFIKLQLN